MIHPSSRIVCSLYGYGRGSRQRRCSRQSDGDFDDARALPIGRSQSICVHCGTVSRSIQKFAKAPCMITWSVHAANDELRRKLVPTTRYPIVELREGLIEALMDRPANLRTTMLEVALMKGVNDGIEHADDLAEFSRVISECVPDSKIMVNLIPFDGIGNTEFEKPDDEDIVAFEKRLQSLGLFTHVRTTGGDDQIAACGQ